MIKYDHALLRGKIAEKGFSQKQMADAIGCDPNTFSRKMLNKSDFTVTEIMTLMYLLNIEDPREYFFKL